MNKFNTTLLLIFLLKIAFPDSGFSMPNNISTSDTIIMPPNFDGKDRPTLQCDGQVNKSINVGLAMLNSPICVGEEILDSAFWYAHPGEPDEYPKRRLPKILGWNYIDDSNDPNFNHPNPDTLYYPEHNVWSPSDPLCWGPNQHIMGSGTGRPFSPDCSTLVISYTDSIINHVSSSCDPNTLNCYDILRSWIIFDLCSGVESKHVQVIKITDTIPPFIIYPDTILINSEAFNCGRWEVSTPYLTDNCSLEIHYQIEFDSAMILGNDTTGYVVVNIQPGIHTAYIVASDCCGNTTRRPVILQAEDHIPPNAVCSNRRVVSITGNQSPGHNFTKVFARDLDQGSIDNCATTVYFKTIRLDQLKGTGNGSVEDQNDNGTNCKGFNGDDDSTLVGNQIYFDDYTSLCCSDVGQTIQAVLRVFELDPGPGPVTPSRMSKGGDLFNHYTDCLSDLEVQDKSVPTLVSPPDIVISCAFQFDISKLNDPNDSTFGKVVTDLSLRRKVYTKDIVCYNYCIKNDKTGYPGNDPGAPPSNPPAGNRACEYYLTLFDTAHADRTYSMAWGFDGYSLSACDNVLSLSVTDKRVCGQGRIDRRITTTGANGIKVSATQTIWIVDCDPFYINRTDACDPNDDIIWPGNCNGTPTIISDCRSNTNPDNPLLGKPVIDHNADDKCALISMSYSDEVITILPDTCLRILRTWVVTDFCQYDPSIDTLTGKWKHVQEINILNVVGTEDKKRNNNEFYVMPNPSYGTVFIKSSYVIDHIKVISSLGKTCTYYSIPDNHSIELNNTSPGVYFIQAYYKGQHVASTKFVIVE